MVSYKKVNVGLLGAGKMGSFHAKILSALPGVVFQGIFDTDQTKNAELANKYNIKAFPSIEELLENSEAVIVATPTPTHLALGSLCLENGKHTFIEKPLAASAAHAKELVSLAREKKLILGVGQIERQNPAFKALEENMKSELLLSVEARRMSPFPERMAKEGVVSDMMIHDLDLVLHLAKSEPKEITILNKKGNPATLDLVVAKIFFASGLIAKLTASRLHSEKERKVLAVCEEHDFEADLLNKKLNRSIHQKPEEAHPLEAKKTEEIFVANYDQLAKELQLFIFSARREKYLCVSGEEGLRAVALAEEIERLAAC